MSGHNGGRRRKKNILIKLEVEICFFFLFFYKKKYINGSVDVQNKKTTTIFIRLHLYK